MRIAGAYLLIAVVVALGVYVPAPPALQFPRTLCTSVGVPGLTFELHLCTEKLSYNVGEIANITVGFGNSGSSMLWGREGDKLQIIHEGTVVFTDAQGCAIPEGCLYRPGEIHPWIFHLPPLEAGDYTALMTLMGIVDCSGVCKPVFSGGTTIGLTFTVLSK